jgi:hypothetical protein
MRATLLVAFLLIVTGCASLPPTQLSVCAEHFEVVCMSNAVSTDRDYAWEAVHACPWPPKTRRAPCYEFAGGRDSRQVYRYEWNQ